MKSDGIPKQAEELVDVKSVSRTIACCVIFSILAMLCFFASGGVTPYKRYVCLVAGTLAAIAAISWYFGFLCSKGSVSSGDSGARLFMVIFLILCVVNWARAIVLPD